MVARWERDVGKMGGEVRGLRSMNRIAMDTVKYSIGNGVAKELTCMIHGHELLWGEFTEGVGDAG